MSEEKLSELEQEFTNAVNVVGEKIDAKIKVASEALREAVKLSEKHGVPFYSGISFLGQSYIPASLNDKWPDLELEFAYETTSTWSEYGNEGGWEHSAVC